jgi:hypothetical protein
MKRLRPTFPRARRTNVRSRDSLGRTRAAISAACSRGRPLVGRRWPQWPLAPVPGGAHRQTVHVLHVRDPRRPRDESEMLPHVAPPRALSGNAAQRASRSKGSGGAMGRHPSMTGGAADHGLAHVSPVTMPGACRCRWSWLVVLSRCLLHLFLRLARLLGDGHGVLLGGPFVARVDLRRRLRGALRLRSSKSSRRSTGRSSVKFAACAASSGIWRLKGMAARPSYSMAPSSEPTVSDRAHLPRAGRLADQGLHDRGPARPVSGPARCTARRRGAAGGEGSQNRVAGHHRAEHFAADSVGCIPPTIARAGIHGGRAGRLRIPIGAWSTRQACRHRGRTDPSRRRRDRDREHPCSPRGQESDDHNPHCDDEHRRSRRHRSRGQLGAPAAATSRASRHCPPS